MHHPSASANWRNIARLKCARGSNRAPVIIVLFLADGVLLGVFIVVMLS